MKWKTARRSENVNDQRKGTDARNKTGIAGMAIVAAVVAGMGTYWAELTEKEGEFTAGMAQAQYQAVLSGMAIADPHKLFTEVILGSTEDVWKKKFAEMGREYQAPTLSLVTGKVNTPCNDANAPINFIQGPSYCPANKHIYVDISAFEKWATEGKLTGEFVEAYALAHEVGHHVQTELGLTKPLYEALVAKKEIKGATGLLVRAELQADCLAGVWAAEALLKDEVLLTKGDSDALEIAATTLIGDDKDVRPGAEKLMPQDYGHGTAKQRLDWVQKGMQSGLQSDSLNSCDTFNAKTL